MTAFDVAKKYGHAIVMKELEKHTPAATEAVKLMTVEPQPTSPTVQKPYVYNYSSAYNNKLVYSIYPACCSCVH